MRSATGCRFAAGILCAVSARAVTAQVPSGSPGETVQVSFAADAVGREPKTFAPMVGS
jgi:hypothetical protein